MNGQLGSCLFRNLGFYPDGLNGEQDNLHSHPLRCTTLQPAPHINYAKCLELLGFFSELQHY